MEKLPQEVLPKFMKEEQVMRHQQSYRNGNWLDMYIEVIFMRYGIGPGRNGGATLKSRVIKKWANSLHICSEILKDSYETQHRETSKHLEFHKEAGKAQIRSDVEDRDGLRDTLKKRINPLDTNVNGLVNMLIGIKAQNGNVCESIKLGEQQCQQFEASWSDAFYNVTKKEVRTIKSGFIIEKFENTNYRIKFVFTFLADIHVRADPESLHEEAGIDIIKQCTECVKGEVNFVKVICDDTDAFSC